MGSTSVTYISLTDLQELTQNAINGKSILSTFGVSHSGALTMKTVRITEDSHERLTKVAGRLQVARGANVSLDAAIMTSTSEVFTVSEIFGALRHWLNCCKIVMVIIQ